MLMSILPSYLGCVEDWFFPALLHYRKFTTHYELSHHKTFLDVPPGWIFMCL